MEEKKGNSPTHLDKLLHEGTPRMREQTRPPACYTAKSKTKTQSQHKLCQERVFLSLISGGASGIRASSAEGSDGAQALKRQIRVRAKGCERETLTCTTQHRALRES